jgi:hypothetical protein
MNVRTTSLFALASSLLLAATFGCSSAVSPGTATNIATTQATVPVLITDAPSDQLVSFSLTLNSITLTDTAGRTASILSTPTTVEICHLNGIQAPLVTASIPQDTYVSATITFSNPEITYINSSGQPVSVTPTLAATSFTYTFPTPGPFTGGNTSSALLVDLLASQSVTISGATVTVSPVFALKPVPVATAVPPPGQNGTGMQQMATVVSVSGTSLTLEPGSGPNFTVTTNSSTVLQGFTALSSLTAGELVQVDFIVQSGGAYLATRIQLAPPPPAGQSPVNLLSGPVTSVSSGSFKMVLMQGLGPAVPVSATAVSTFTVTTNSSTTFAITPQFVSLTGLPFTPSFTAANLTAGQSVGVVTSSITGSTAVASDVYLIPETVGGTVSAITPSGSYTAYTLTLNSGSAFTSLSGASTLTVYTSTDTAPPPPSATTPPAIAVGSNVRFNGLIFSLGSGNFAMVAACSPDGAPGV